MNDAQRAVISEFVQSPPGELAIATIKKSAERTAALKLDACSDAAMAAVHLARLQGAIEALDAFKSLSSPKQEVDDFTVRPKRAIR